MTPTKTVFEEEETVTLSSYCGFVDKKELRDKLFNNSKRMFLKNITAYRNYDKSFDALYAPFHLKNFLPLWLAKLFLDHLERAYQFKA